MPAIRRPADRADPAVLAFDAVLGESGLGVGFLEVDKDYVAAAYFDTVLAAL